MSPTTTNSIPGCTSPRMQYTSWIKNLCMLLYLQKEKYISLVIKDESWTDPHLPSLSKLTREFWLFALTNSCSAKLQLFLPKGNIFSLGVITSVPLNNKFWLPHRHFRGDLHLGTSRRKQESASPKGQLTLIISGKLGLRYTMGAGRTCVATL